MSDYASVVERTRKAFASVARLEAEIARAPDDVGLQVNLAAMNKLARKSQQQLFALSETHHVEVCNYRLVPERAESYALPFVSQSLLSFQYLFTQIYDSFKNGPKPYATYGQEAFNESLMEFAYTYSGSLGVVLLAQSDKDFFSGNLDKSIEALFEVVDIDSRDTVRDIAKTLGNAVIKRLHDWSQANIRGGFAADVRFNRSDGRHLGEMIERRRLENIVSIIQATSDEKTAERQVTGMLVGGDIQSGSFHFVVPNGDDFRGKLAKEFSKDTEMTLGKSYRARIRETTKLTYATEKLERSVHLVALFDVPTIAGPNGPASPVF
ncbi:hypothetical protein ACQR18_30810 [Bradyrhizobium oligotrophicum]|uniref:hypothetical protein n=1 Tax=Bradyrhizobium oligotrophicum TaxID=44255 RepID=UPI003EB8E6C6